MSETSSQPDVHPFYKVCMAHGGSIIACMHVQGGLSRLATHFDRGKQHRGVHPVHAYTLELHDSFNAAVVDPAVAVLSRRHGQSCSDVTAVKI